MKKIKTIILSIVTIFAIMLAFVSPKAYANETISGSASVTIDAEINENKNKVRFIITSSGVTVDQIESIEVNLYKDGVVNKTQLLITTVYTSISNASKEYDEAENTYYGLLTIDDAQKIASSNIAYTATITYTDNSSNTTESKNFDMPNVTMIKYYDHIEFGSYPKSKAEDSVATTLTETYGNPTTNTDWVNYGYSNSSSSEFMYYLDVDTDSDGDNDYRGVYFTEYRSNLQADTGASNSEQDDNGLSVNTVYWYKYEPITWKVLAEEDGKALILAEASLDSQPYATGSATSYKESYVRSYLIDTFYNQAFNDVQKSFIRTTTLDNDNFGITGENTSDKVFLLSYNEVANYFTDTESKKVKCTEYAESQNAYTYDDNGGNCEWWTRNLQNSESAYYVTRSGNQVNSKNAKYTYDVLATRNVVRPAMWVDLSLKLTTVDFTYDEYGISLESDSLSVTPNTTINVTATVKEGFTFEGWYNGEECISTNTTLEYTLGSSDISIEARTSGYTLTTTVNDENLGTVTEYDHKGVEVGDVVSLTATEINGSTFDGWYINDELVSSDKTFEYTMTSEDVVIEARFVAYTVTVKSVMDTDTSDKFIYFESNGGTVIAPMSVERIEFPQIPEKSGYLFGGWFENPNFEGETFDFETGTTENTTLYAKWVAKPSDGKYVCYTPNENTIGSFKLKNNTLSDYYMFVPYDDHNNAQVCIYQTNYYPEIKIYDCDKNQIALRSASYDKYRNWEGILEAGEIYYITTKYYNSYSANWTVNISTGVYNGTKSLHTIDTPDYSDYGTATPYGNTNFTVGSTVSVSATQNDSTFLGWYINDTCVSTELTYEFTMIAENVEIIAKYTNYTLTTTVDDTLGSVTEYNNKFVSAGSTVTLEATEKNGSTFEGWYINDTKVSGDKSFEYTMPSENVTIEARYVIYTLTTTVNDETLGSVTEYDGAAVTVGTTVTLTATTNNSVFNGYYIDDFKVSGSLTYEYTMTASDVTIEVRFTAYTLTTTKNISEAGTITAYDNTIISPSTEVELTATVNEGYAFVGWYNGDVLLSNSLSYTYTMTENSVTLTATYQVLSIVVDKNISEAGTVTIPTNILYGENVTLTTTINNGYIFLGWYDGDTLLTTELSYTFTANESVSLAVKYALNEMTTSTNFNWGTVTSFDEALTIGTYQEITATANEGYTFVGWYKNGILYSTDSTIRVAVETGFVNYEANFTYYTVTVNINPTEACEAIETIKATVGTQVTITFNLNAGYTYIAIYDEDDDYVTSATSYTFTMTAKDYEFKVECSINTNTAYTVKHYKQNIDDNEYTLSDTDNLVGTTNTQTAAVAKDYDGFTVQSFSQDTILGDGSTLIEIYYTRNIYQLSVLANAGLEAALNVSDYETSYKYGKEITITVSANPGYTLQNVYANNVEVENPYTFTMPSSDVEIVATYARRTDTAYTVNYYQADLNNDYPNEPTSTEVLTGTTDATVSYDDIKDFTGFEKQSFDSVTIAGDGSTVVNVYYLRYEYQILITINNPEDGSFNTSSTVEWAYDSQSDSYSTNQSFVYGSTVTLEFLPNYGYYTEITDGTNTYGEQDNTNENNTTDSFEYTVNSSVTITVTYQGRDDTAYNLYIYLPTNTADNYVETGSYEYDENYDVIDLKGVTGTTTSYDTSSMDVLLQEDTKYVGYEAAQVINTTITKTYVNDVLQKEYVLVYLGYKQSTLTIERNTAVCNWFYTSTSGSDGNYDVYYGQTVTITLCVTNNNSYVKLNRFDLTVGSTTTTLEYTLGSVNSNNQQEYIVNYTVGLTDATISIVFDAYVQYSIYNGTESSNTLVVSEAISKSYEEGTTIDDDFISQLLTDAGYTSFEINSYEAVHYGYADDGHGGKVREYVEATEVDATERVTITIYVASISNE